MPFPASHPALDRALSERGYAEPTPVQAAVLEVPGEQDLLVSAQTGSGKTVAFGLAMAGTILGPQDERPDNAEPLALIVAPTRELALQVSRELEWLYAATGARIATCVGGMDPRAERRVLERGATIVVGTPGRLCDHLDRGALDLSRVRVVVLDEADEMLDMGFAEDLTALLKAAPEQRRTLLFSATIAREIAELAKTYQRDAVRIDTTRRDVPHGDIEYRAIRVAPHEVEHGVVNVLRYFESPGALVFANTRERVKHLTASLRERGFSVVGLSGELTQSLRSEALQALRDGHARVCVATDVAARGLDLPDLGLVIHAEIPVNKATLLHRSGRTGRAGRKGTSVLMVTHTRRRKVELMLQSAAIKADWSGPPSADAILEKDRERMMADPVLVEPADEETVALGQALLDRVGAEQAAAALIRLYRQKLPPPEDIQDDLRMARAQSERPGRETGDFAQSGPMAWFRIDIGRDKNADPKWLLPLICRLGGVSKSDIGAIRIFERETKFEITQAAEVGFRKALSTHSGDDATITDAVAPSPGERTARRFPSKGERPPPRPFRARTRVEGAAPAAEPGDRPTPRREARLADRSTTKPARPIDGGDRPWTGPGKTRTSGAKARPAATPGVAAGAGKFKPKSKTGFKPKGGPKPRRG